MWANLAAFLINLTDLGPILVLQETGRTGRTQPYAKVTQIKS